MQRIGKILRAVFEINDWSITGGSYRTFCLRGAKYWFTVKWCELWKCPSQRKIDEQEKEDNIGQTAGAHVNYTKTDRKMIPFHYIQDFLRNRWPFWSGTPSGIPWRASSSQSPPRLGTQGYLCCLWQNLRVGSAGGVDSLGRGGRMAFWVQVQQCPNLHWAGPLSLTRQKIVDESQPVRKKEDRKKWTSGPIKVAKMMGRKDRRKKEIGYQGLAG